MGDAAIEVRDGWRRLGGRDVLRGVSCAFPSHRLTVLTGPTAAGKSVLLRHLVGLERLDSGEVIAEGLALSALSAAELLTLRRRWGVQTDGPGALFSSLTVADNVAFPLRAVLRMPEGAVRKAVAERLEQVGLEAAGGLYPQQLSLGERIRAAFARAVAVRPRLLILDTPETGHDAVALAEFGRVIAATQASLECALILVTQDRRLTLELAHHVVLLDAGEVVAEGPPGAIRSYLE